MLPCVSCVSWIRVCTPRENPILCVREVGRKISTEMIGSFLEREIPIPNYVPESERWGVGGWWCGLGPSRGAASGHH
jgi:hypothetical protein